MSGKNKAIILLLVTALLLSGCVRAETGQSSEITEASGVSDIPCESEVSEESDVSDAVGEVVTYEYDDEGNPIKEFHCDADGNVGYYCEFSYSGKRLSCMTVYTSDGEPTCKTQYVYDGYRLEKTHLFDNKDNLVKITFYDGDGNVDYYTECVGIGIIETNRKADGTIISTVEPLYSEGYYSFLLMSEYDENGVAFAQTVLKHDMGDRTVVMKYEFEDRHEVKLTAMGGVFFDKTVYSYVKEYDGGQLSCLTWYDRNGAEKLRREYGDGRAVKDIYKNADGSVGGYAVISEWNDDNQPISAKLYDPDNAHIGKTEYVYGEDGRLTCEKTYDLGGHKIKEMTLTYEGYGRLSTTDEKRFDKNGLQTYGVSCSYEDVIDVVSEFDDRGKLVKCSAYRFDGELENYVLRDYYENGNPKKDLCYNADGELIGEIDYDINGNKTESASYNDGSYTGGYKSEYSAEGLLIREITLDANKNVQWTCEHKYIETDGIRSKTEYNADGQKVYYIEYAVDDDGNWKEAHRYEYKDGELICHTVMEEVDGITIYNVYDANGELVRKYYYDESGYCGTPIVIQ